MLKSFLHTLKIKDLKPLSGFHNQIYEGIYQDDSIIIRISDRRNQHDIEEEITVLNQIKKAVNIVEPYKVNNHYVTTYKKYTMAFFKKIEGLNWHETTLTNAVHFNAGKALGLLHLSLQTINDVHRNHYDAHPDIALLSGLDAGYDKEIHAVLSRLRSYNPQKNEYGLIHGDYLYSNLIYHGEDVTIIDFDDMEYGYYVYDIAVYLFYLLLGGNPDKIDIEPNIEVFKHFMKGYLSVNQQTYLDFTKMQAMFRLRQLKLLATIKTKIEPSKYGAWQTAYIKRCDKQFMHKQDFVNIPYQTIYNDIKLTTTYKHVE